MKLRISGDSVRIRLKKTEVTRLAAGERIEQTTSFSIHSRLTSSVESSSQVDHPKAIFAGDHLSVLLPAARVNAWAHSEEVTIEGSQRIAANQMLQILVEKDFVCLHTTSADAHDRFPNPQR